MATLAETRRLPLDLAEATARCAAALRGLGPDVRVEVENPQFGLVVARRGPDEAAERFRWELWPVEPRLTEAKLAIESPGVGFFQRGRLKETADRLFEQVA